MSTLYWDQMQRNNVKMQMSVKLFKTEILRLSEYCGDILGAIRAGHS